MDIDLISDRAVSGFYFFRNDGEDRALPNAVSEDDLIHADCDKTAVGKVEAGCDPARFINPPEKPSAEEEPELIQVPGQDEPVGFHR